MHRHQTTPNERPWRIGTNAGVWRRYSAFLNQLVRGARELFLCHTMPSQFPPIFIAIVKDSSLIHGIQNFLWVKRLIENLAVSAMAMTAMTPAWIGSLTTKSATSGTLPAMLRDMTIMPFS
jgi:hypothetical protein